MLLLCYIAHASFVRVIHSFGHVYSKMMSSVPSVFSKQEIVDKGTVPLRNYSSLTGRVTMGHIIFINFKVDILV